MRRKAIIISLVLILLIAGGYYYFTSRNSFSKEPLIQDQRKTVAAYFVEYMKATPQEAMEMASDGVDLRVGKDSTLQGIIGNLYYYGFIDNEEQFAKLLEATEDTTPGKEDVIKAGNNTIDINSHYYLNYQMSDEEIADTLLNKGRYMTRFSDYTYLFMPSGPEGSRKRPEN